MKGRNLEIRVYGDPVLQKKAKAVEKITEEILQLIADLKVTMQKKEGLGLAANQVGVSLAVIAVNPKGAKIEQEPFVVINPEIVECSGQIEREEGCLSIPGINEVVARPAKVIVKGINEEGKTVQINAEGLLARVFSHEIDHIKGIFFVNYLGKTRLELLQNQLKEIAKNRKSNPAKTKRKNQK
jgi:peptide deformylase